MTALTTWPRSVAIELAAAAALMALTPAQAGVVATNILSGGSWRSSATSPVGWETLSYDDTAWAFARAPYPGGGGIPGSAAVSIWHDPAGTSNGTNGVTTAFFRYAFDLDGLTPTFGQARIQVDDDYAFYVNGTLAYLNNDNGFGGSVQTVQFTSLLRSGRNVFAIHAVDGGWSNPRDRGNESFTFDATLQGVAVPATPWLVGLALAAALGTRRRRG